jgi:hypothetical protein
VNAAEGPSAEAEYFKSSKASRVKEFCSHVSQDTKRKPLPNND